jgi:hypothetical protein
LFWISYFPKINSFFVAKKLMKFIAGNVYKIEVIEPGKESLSYVEAPTHWVKSHIRDKKINQIIE